ncbi:MAG: T9SS type A sorting domain-containing protein [Bacteroidota bacterium]
MKALFTLFLSIISLSFFAQTSHDVEAFGGGTGNPTPAYEPQNITIMVGDTVRWTNTQGTHNVDGTLSAFPSNPEGFTSGDPAPAPWVFEYEFTVAGTYDYECSAFNHADTQFGTITVVEDPTALQELNILDFYIYPNPSETEINVLTQAQIDKIEILDVSRNVSITEEPQSVLGSYTINTSDLEAGIYFIVIYQGEYKGVKRFIKR